MTVNVYTYSQSKGPKRQALGYGYVLECEREGKEPVTLSKIGISEGSNQEISVLAVLEALRRLSKDADLIIYTESEYAFGGLAHWMAIWKHAGFTNSKGEDIANKAIWGEIAQILESHPFKVKLKEDHQYKAWLKQECARKEGNKNV